MNKFIWLLIFMTMLGAFAGFFFKKASGSKNMKTLFFNYNFYLGGILYSIAALINIYVLRFLEFSIVFPMTSITYIWTMLISYLVLKERITAVKISGVILIVIGAVVMAYV